MDESCTSEVVFEEQVEVPPNQPVYVQLQDNAQTVLQEATGEICIEQAGEATEPVIHYVHVVPAPVEGQEQKEEVEAEEIQIIQQGRQLTAVGQEHHDLGLLQQAMMLIQQSLSATGQVDTVSTIDTVSTVGEHSGVPSAIAVPGQVEGAQIIEESKGDAIAPSALAPAATDVINHATTPPEDVTDGTPQLLATNATEVTEATADPIVVVPLKRRRGRPRKQPISQAPPQPKTLPPSPPKPDIVQVSSTGRPKRKAALKFLESWEALKKKPHLDDDLEPSPPPSPEHRQTPRPVQQESATQNKDHEKEVIPATVSVTQPVAVNITIKDKKALQVIEDIGIHMLYYCKHCAFHSKQLMTITDHILNICRPNRLSKNESPTDPSITAAILENVSLKDIKCKKYQGDNQDSDAIHIDEHNYAAEVTVAPEAGLVEGAEEQKSQAEDWDVRDDMNISISYLQPRKWFCSVCPYTVFYSEMDLDVHRFCHGKSGNLPLHCYACREKNDNPTKRTKLQWHSLRVHLNKFHKVNFQLVCTKCEEVSSCHSLFHRHTRNHCHQCSHSSCQFVTEKYCDLEVHEKCHVAENPGNFSCHLCGYQSTAQPDNWPDLHRHLFAEHPEIISPLYTCNMCREGFKEARKFMDHKLQCNENHYRVCKICSECIHESMLSQHVEVHPGMEEDLIYQETASSKSHEDHSVEQVPSSIEDTGQGDDGEEVIANGIPTEGTGQESQSRDEKSDEVVKVRDIEKESGEERITTITLPTALFHCRQHSQQFTSQEALTKHFAEDHWGATEKEIRTLKEQVKRRPGRPRKYPRPESCDESGTQAGPKRLKLPQLRGVPKTEKCKHCYKKFPSQQHLQHHISRTHTEEKLRRMVCQACGKDFRNRTQWRNHYRTVHEGKKRKKVFRPHRKPTQKKMFVCELCGYTTPEGLRLRNHKMSVHEGQMPYQCSRCDYKTNEKADMRRHSDKHNGIKRYACQVSSTCKYRSDQRWLLVNHLWRNHGVQMKRITRDTRGSYWSNRRRRTDNQTDLAETSVIGPQTVTHEVFIDSQMAQSVEGQEVAEQYFVPVVTTNENGEEEVAMYAIGGDTITEQEVAVHTVEEEAKTEEVVYIHEDGTVVEAEEAALMLMAVGPAGEETT